MPSVLPDFEYDIFISYRHNDNLDSWVTHFVQHLEKELKGTIKESVSIYFDRNPHDGLLESHNVDKSLEGKLKCLIFVPIISQTYCDPKSFAWQHEFCAFNKISMDDPFGRDIQLGNGNVASRILPVKIHSLDAGDIETIESEINGMLRSIEFIYTEPGVNRPLQANDKKDENQNHTDYRNQVNKVANAIKEILNALTHRDTVSKKSGESPWSSTLSGSSPRKSKTQLIILLILVVAGSFVAYWYFTPNEQGGSSNAQSIAILPFADMSPEKDQEYLGDGIAEEIINVLAQIEGLQVIGRTSSFSFKGKNIDLITIGDQLGAGTILEGSVRKSDNKIRVTAQLINAADGSHLWSETYDRELDDIFAIQDDISRRIAERLQATLGDGPALGPTTNTEAYEYYLKGLLAAGKGIVGVENARDYMLKAIALDSTFALAYAQLSQAYWSIRLYGLHEPESSYQLARRAALKAIEVNPKYYAGYRALAWINFSIDWDWDAAANNNNKAIALRMPLPDDFVSYYEFLAGHYEAAIQNAQDVLTRDPLSMSARLSLTRTYLYADRLNDALENSKKIFIDEPDNPSNLRHMGEAYLFSERPEEALPLFQRLRMKDPTYAPQGYVGSLVKLGRRKEAEEVMRTLPASVTPARKAFCFIHLDQMDSVFKYLDIAYREKDIYMVFLQSEPHFKLLRQYPQYQALLKKMNFPE
jgi:TolB-like protein